MERRDVKTSWKELLKAFISSDSDLEKQENEEEIKFNNEYSAILSQSNSDISSLEEMLEHPDIKVKGRRKQVRKQSRLKGKQPTIEKTTQRVKEDREMDR